MFFFSLSKACQVHSCLCIKGIWVVISRKFRRIKEHSSFHSVDKESQHALTSCTVFGLRFNPCHCCVAGNSGPFTAPCCTGNLYGACTRVCCTRFKRKCSFMFILHAEVWKEQCFLRALHRANFNYLLEVSAIRETEEVTTSEMREAFQVTIRYFKRYLVTLRSAVSQLLVNYLSKLECMWRKHWDNRACLREKKFIFWRMPLK